MVFQKFAGGCVNCAGFLIFIVTGDETEL